jgi:hypothetical protein
MNTACEAGIPRPGVAGRITLDTCGVRATALHRYACVHEHVVERRTCDDHAPEPDSVGCRACLEAGHECGMSFELIELIELIA